MTFLAVNWGNALLITGVGFGLVFTVLVLLIFIVKLFGVIFVQKPKAQPAVAAAAPAESADDETVDLNAGSAIAQLSTAGCQLSIACLSIGKLGLGTVLIKKYPEQLHTVNVRDMYELKDVDSPEDLSELLER